MGYPKKKDSLIGNSRNSYYSNVVLQSEAGLPCGMYLFWVSLNKLESVIAVQLRGGFIKAGALPELLQSVTDLKTFYYW